MLYRKDSIGICIDDLKSSFGPIFLNAQFLEFEELLVYLLKTFAANWHLFLNEKFKLPNVSFDILYNILHDKATFHHKPAVAVEILLSWWNESRNIPDRWNYMGGCRALLETWLTDIAEVKHERNLLDLQREGKKIMLFRLKYPLAFNETYKLRRVFEGLEESVPNFPRCMHCKRSFRCEDRCRGMDELEKLKVAIKQVPNFDYWLRG
ncbi:hypothetical protein BC829DRAFT_387027 [Chytridium lagenaria]|nr:hypothetical protein BC829DRAFT_387027 [Chytridium lagenaria]